MCVSISLVALALGYKIFADAHKEKEGIKLLGQIIGVVVMIAALLSVVCGVAKCMKRLDYSMKSKSNCAMVAKTSCPMHAAEEPSK